MASSLTCRTPYALRAEADHRVASLGGWRDHESGHRSSDRRTTTERIAGGLFAFPRAANSAQQGDGRPEGRHYVRKAYSYTRTRYAGHYNFGFPTFALGVVSASRSPSTN
jgi:hypothetical protein